MGIFVIILGRHFKNIVIDMGSDYIKTGQKGEGKNGKAVIL